jgi:two-component system, OmpR family, sensor kinase
MLRGYQDPGAGRETRRVPSDGVHGGRAVRGLLAGVPLRVRLVAVACCVAAAGAAIMGLACSLVVRGGLMWQADQELRAYAALVTSRPFTAMPVGSGPGGVADDAFVIEVVSGGQLVMRTGLDRRPGPALEGIPDRAGQLATVAADSGAASWLVVAQPVHYSAQRILFTYGSDDFSLHITSTARPGTAGTLVVGLDLSSVGQTIRKITVSYAAVSGVAVLVIVFLGLAVIRAMLRPLAQMEKTAAGVVGYGLSHQVPGDHPGSFAGSLARPFNAILSQVEDARLSADAARRSSERMRSLLAGTCRELRRPVSIIRGSAEYFRQRGPLTARELDRMMGRVADEAARMDALIDDLAGTGHGQSRPPVNDGRTCSHEREEDGCAGATQ